MVSRRRPGESFLQLSLQTISDPPLRNRLGECRVPLGNGGGDRRAGVGLRGSLCAHTRLQLSGELCDMSIACHDLSSYHSLLPVSIAKPLPGSFVGAPLGSQCVKRSRKAREKLLDLRNLPNRDGNGDLRARYCEIAPLSGAYRRDCLMTAVGVEMVAVGVETVAVGVETVGQGGGRGEGGGRDWGEMVEGDGILRGGAATCTWARRR